MEYLSSSNKQSWLSWFLRGILILGFLVIIGRLVDLQLIRGSYFRNLSEKNRIRRVSISAPRGRILARGGETLVGNKEVKKSIIFDPIGGYKKVDYSESDGGDAVTEWMRDYRLGPTTAHVTGYLGEISNSEVDKIDPKCSEKGVNKTGNLTGRGGLEEVYNCLLSGVDGEELIEVDAAGHKIRTLGKKEPIAGKDLITTIDFGLQNEIPEIIKEAKDLPQTKKGSVIVSDTEGEILALYSFPSFDPNVFIERDEEKIEELLNDKNLPLYNRTISGLYHPGSTFKPIVSIASLEENIIDSGYIYEDTGKIDIDTSYGNFSFTNWYYTQYGGVEGKINLTRALARSTDTFFYKLGEMLGVDKMGNWANRFQFDSLSGIDLTGEIGGIVPSPKWKMEVIGERWFLGNTYHMSIGQGFIAVTPLSLNRAISAISNNGKLCKPHILKSEETQNNKCDDIKLKSDNTDLVREGMIEACSEGGTGFTFFDFKEKYGFEVACKTGTAETDDNSNPHAWFVAFAPAEKPQVVTTVLVENGGEGSKIAGPIAREVFNYWFSK